MGTARETHELSFEEFDARVSVENDGEVWVSFHEAGKCVFTIFWKDLREVVDFTALHGLQLEEWLPR